MQLFTSRWIATEKKMASPIERAWNSQLEEQMISLWSSWPCLYDPASTDYCKRDRRARALTEIAESLDMPVQRIKVRMTSFRTQFSKLQKVSPSGSEASKLTRKEAWIIEKLQFLKPFITIRQTTSSLDDSLIVNQESDEEHIHFQVGCEEDVDDSAIDATDMPIRPQTTGATKRPIESKRRPLTAKQIKKKRDECELQLLQTLSGSLNAGIQDSQKEENEEISYFSKYISKCLQDMDKVTRNVVKHEIQNVIFKGQMGMLPSTFYQGQHNQPYSQSYSQTDCINSSGFVR